MTTEENNCKLSKFDEFAKNRNRLIIQQKYNHDTECPICMDSMLHRSVLHTPCKHVFHINCLFKVFQYGMMNYKCPLCRHDFVSSLWALFMNIDFYQYLNVLYSNDESFGNDEINE